jgi:hypothetical protein
MRCSATDSASGLHALTACYNPRACMPLLKRHLFAGFELVTQTETTRR